MMTKQNFEALAKALRANKPSIEPGSLSRPPINQWYNDVIAVAAVCEFSNPAFNLKRFLLAAGFERAEKERYCL